MSKIGINDIVKAYHGSAEVSKIYLGTTVVYEAGGGVIPDYLCFTANQSNSKVRILNNGSNNPNVEYSTDDGTTWTTMISDTFITLSNVGDKMYVRGNNPNGFSTSPSNYTKFNMSGSIDVSGNIMSLIDTTLQTTTIPNYWCFAKLFNNNTSLRSAENLKLPATTLTYDCYREMFSYCTSLTTAPSVLPATTLVSECYREMFSYCTSLTTAPNLPATTLVEYCYYYMFRKSSNLSYIKAMFTNNPNTSSATGSWVSGVASSGSFIMNSQATWNPADYRNANGIPDGWVVYDENGNVIYDPREPD